MHPTIYTANAFAALRASGGRVGAVDAQAIANDKAAVSAAQTALAAAQAAQLAASGPGGDPGVSDPSNPFAIAVASAQQQLETANARLVADGGGPSKWTTPILVGLTGVALYAVIKAYE